MLFQTLDDKSECVGVYTDKRIIFDPKEFPDSISRTWDVAPYLRKMPDIEYASLYLEGQNIDEHIPEYFKDDWVDVCKKIGAFKRSLTTSCIDTTENCFFDLVPQRFLIEYCEVKNRITDHVLKTIKRPNRYEFYKQVAFMLRDISDRRLVLDRTLLKSYLGDKKLHNQSKSILECAPCVKYNQFGTKTGRLTTKPNTFPILTLNKSLRGVVQPSNDYFVELDFNGAEVRTLLGILKKPQPTTDVHDFHLKNIFRSLTTRSEAKTSFFAWLYGSSQATSAGEMKELAAFYEKEKLLDKYWDGSTVVTPYKKRIENVSRHHALNYLIQSTAADLMLKQALKMDYLLRTRSRGSQIAFLIHDAVVIDMKKEDAPLLNLLLSLMRSTNFGNFEINMKKGTTLGSMREFELV